jgi:hypothetical protein
MNSSELRITEATLAFVKGFNLAQIIYQIIYLTIIKSRSTGALQGDVWLKRSLKIFKSSPATQDGSQRC